TSKRDWTSDVCSADLAGSSAGFPIDDIADLPVNAATTDRESSLPQLASKSESLPDVVFDLTRNFDQIQRHLRLLPVDSRALSIKIGRAPCREGMGRPG